MSQVHLEYVPLRTPEGLTLYLKHPATRWMFRLIPFRDPDQPRLWCIRVEACAGPSMSAKTARIDPFYTSLGKTREQLGETLKRIQAGLESWLEDAEQRELRRWLGYVVSLPTPENFIPPEPPVRLAKAVSGQPVSRPIVSTAAQVDKST